MKATPKYLIPELIGSLRTRSFMLLCLCAAFPMTTYGDSAVGVIQGDVFMSWIINSTDTSSFQVVINPANFTVIYFPSNNATGIPKASYTNRVTDIGNVSLGMVSFRLLNLTVADAGRYYYRLVSGSDAGGQILVIARNPANITVIEVTDPFENEKYTVQCSAQSTSVPPGMGLTMYYQWMRENGQIITADDRYSFSSDQSNLIINPLKRQDAGTLVCKAWEHVGAVSQSGPFSLKVFYGPDTGSIHLSPNITSFELTESSPLSVNCSTDCFPDCQYQWTGPGGSSASSTGLLSIISVVRSQTGQYICTSSNPKIPNKTDAVALSVIVFYGPDTNGTTLTPSNTSYQLTELSSFTVQCSATCVPQCNYQWMGPGVSQNGSRGLLYVSQVSRNQTGTFACTVTNPKMPGKSATASISVIVYYGPDALFSLNPVTTSYRNIEGTFIPNITCSANCNPQCNYQWIGPLSTISSGVLFLGTLDRLNQGFYFCKATNPRTSMSVNGSTVYVVVIYGPDIPHLSPSTTVYTKLEGESLPDINCSADCFPGCTQVWMKGVAAVQESHGTALSLGQVYRDKAGDYTCWFNNTESRAKGNISIKLVVQYPPVLTMKASNTSKGGRVVINCTASGVPGNFTFYKWTHMAPDESRTKVRELEVTRVSGSEVLFTIEGATYQDTGFYVCKASNGITHYSTGQLIMEDMVSVLITGPPETPINLSVVTDSVTTHSLQLIWQAGFHGGASQPFVIEYREAGQIMWLNKSEPRGLVQYVTLNATITDLKDGTKYEFRIYSENVFNRSQVSSTINETTKTVPSTYESPDSSVAGIAGDISAGLVVILVIGIVLILWKRNQHKKQTTHDNDVTKEPEERHDAVSGEDNEGRHLTRAEASPNLQLNDIVLDEKRNTNTWSPEIDSSEKLHTYANDDIQMYSSLKIPNVFKDSERRSPESDSYDKLHTYANSDIQMYSSLKIPNDSKDSERRYENTWIE